MKAKASSKKTSDCRPQLSLSNGMWLGDIPAQLDNLTLPERLLLAKYFPSAYIVKLFLKHKNAQNARSWDRSQMHSARLHLPTGPVDPCQIASMIDGTMFPQPAKILSATIGITFVGPKGFCESTNLKHVVKYLVTNRLWKQWKQGLGDGVDP